MKLKPLISLNVGMRVKGYNSYYELIYSGTIRRLYTNDGKIKAGVERDDKACGGGPRYDGYGSLWAITLKDGYWHSDDGDGYLVAEQEEKVKNWRKKLSQ